MCGKGTFSQIRSHTVCIHGLKHKNNVGDSNRAVTSLNSLIESLYILVTTQGKYYPRVSSVPKEYVLRLLIVS